MTIDFDRIKKLTERSPFDPITETISDPLADLSPEAQEQAIRDSRRTVRKDKRDRARAELQQTQLENEIRTTRDMEEDLSLIHI